MNREQWVFIEILKLFKQSSAFRTTLQLMNTDLYEVLKGVVEGADHR